MRGIGWAITGLLTLALAFSATMKFLQPGDFIDQFVTFFGYPATLAVTIGIVELSCLALYLVPRTSVLGAVLLTAYLGGAVATHVRVQDVWVAPVILGMLVWFALYLRDERIRALLPLRAAPGAHAPSQT